MGHSCGGDTSLLVVVSESVNVHSLFKEVLIALQWIVSWVEVFVWRSMRCLE
jgi:hypothetical protein